MEASRKDVKREGGTEETCKEKRREMEKRFQKGERTNLDRLHGERLEENIERGNIETERLACKQKGIRETVYNREGEITKR